MAKNLLHLLLILSIIGILWLRSGFWEFDREYYVNSQVLEKAQLFEIKLDLEFLEKEFGPAYEY